MEVLDLGVIIDLLGILGIRKIARTSSKIVQRINRVKEPSSKGILSVAGMEVVAISVTLDVRNRVKIARFM